MRTPNSVYNSADTEATAFSKDKLIEISVVIVTYNTRDMTLKCLHAICCALRGLKGEIFVVDNASSDGTSDAIRERYPNVLIVENERNVGFGAANNQAMKLAAGNFLLLLNSDAFPVGNAVVELMKFLGGNPDVGVVGPRLTNADGTLQISCYPFPSPGFAWLENLWLSRGYNGWRHDSVREVDFLVGACLLLRRKVFEEVGGFDESFFMYSEEADWQRRMRDRGWKAVFVPFASVTHLGGASGSHVKKEINEHFFESLDRYQRKHHGIIGLVSLRCAMIVGCFLRAMLWAVASVRPSLRVRGLSKFRFHSWLLFRQASHWTLVRW